MTYDQTTRPTFYDSQYLGASDLNAIVDYGHVQMARHILGGHAWGIATGLELIEQPATSAGTPPKGATAVTMFINPGYAWDGFGRPVVVLAPVQISESLFAGYPAGAQPYPVHIWLQYQEVAGQSPAPGFAQCNANQYGAVQESYQIVTGAQSGYTNGRDPISFAGFTVDASMTRSALNPTDATVIADASVPDQTFPDPMGDATWLIPLGFVFWYPATGSQPGMFLARESAATVPSDDTVRVPVGVVAGSVLAVEQSIRMRNRTDTPTAVLSDDLVWVEGPLRVDGDTRVFAGALKFLTVNGAGDPGSISPFCSPSPPSAPIASSPFFPPLMIMREDCSPNSYLEIVIGQGAAGKFTGTSSLQIGPLDNSSGQLVPCVTVLDEGFVGIGTNAPLAPLTFASTGGDKIVFWTQDSSNYDGIGIDTKNNLLQIYCDQPTSAIAFGTGSSGKFKESVRITGNGTNTSVGIGTTTPGYPLSFPDTTGDKISLWGQSGNHYGFGIQGLLMQIYRDQPASAIAFGYGSSAPGLFHENVRITGSDTDTNVGIGTTTPLFPLSFPETTGDKISLWGQSTQNHYGFGIQGNLLQIYCDTSSSAIAVGYGSSTNFSPLMTIPGVGDVTLKSGLNAAGDLTFASGLNAVGALESLRMIRGTYNPDATPTWSGSGVDGVFSPGEVNYTMTFAPAFSAVPSGAITPVGTVPAGTAIVVIILSIANDTVTFQVSDSDGNAVSTGFSFVFVGPR